MGGRKARPYRRGQSGMNQQTNRAEINMIYPSIIYANPLLNGIFGGPEVECELPTSDRCSKETTHAERAFVLE